MIDREARNKLAEQIRHFVAGLKDNFEFDDSVWSIRTKDVGAARIRQEMWYVYDDVRRHKLRGEWALSQTQKAVILRCILFLKSDCEYRWPRKYWDVPLVRLFLGVFTFGFVSRCLDRRWKQSGAWKVWPFFTVGEFDDTNQNPMYLAKTS